MHQSTTGAIFPGSIFYLKQFPCVTIATDLALKVNLSVSSGFFSIYLHTAPTPGVYAIDKIFLFNLLLMGAI